MSQPSELFAARYDIYWLEFPLLFTSAVVEPLSMDALESVFRSPHTKLERLFVDLSLSEFGDEAYDRLAVSVLRFTSLRYLYIKGM